MLHILICILKICGVLLLAAFLLLLAVILAILFVPLRYRADLHFENKPAGSLTATWLFHAFKAEAVLEEELRVKIRLLWFTLFDEILWPDEDETALEEETLPEEELFSAEETLPEKEAVSKEETLPEKEAISKEEPLSEEEAISKKGQLSDEERSSREPVFSEDDDILSATEVRPDKAETAKAEADAPVSEKKRKRRSFLSRIREWIRRFIARLTAFFRNIKAFAVSVQKRYRSFRSIITDEKNRKTFRLVKKQSGALIRHILPRRLKGWIRFGFEDSYYTGKVLTIISPFYGLYGKNISIEPVFDEKVLTGELCFSGRIRLSKLLWCIFRVVMDKNFRIIYRKLRG